MNGWFILDKPHGLGSTQAVAAVKRNLRQAGFGKVKTGHGGTLDPLATGVLPIAVGEATKLTGRMLDASKVYDFTISFGTETDTLDAEGAVVASSDARPCLADIEEVLPQFTGPIEQMPPAYSALKVDGRRAYDIARAGEVVELKARGVVIYALAIRHAELVSASIAPPERIEQVAGWTLKQVQGDGGEGEGLNAITLTAHVSKGTYIRSLARDIAHALGAVGHVTMLRRTKAGPFDLSQAISLDKLNSIGQGAPIAEMLLPFEAGLDDIPALSLTPDQARLARQGRKLIGIVAKDGLYWARDDRMSPIALVQLQDQNLRVVRGFNL